MWSRDERELPRPEPVVDRADGVREHERPHAEQAEHADAEDDLRRGQSLVEMGAAAHDRDRHAAEGADDERAGVADCRGHRPARDVLVRDLDRVVERVREPAETAPEHDADRGRDVRAGTDGRDRSVELVLHDPTLHSFAVPWRWVVVAGLAALVAGSGRQRRPAGERPEDQGAGRDRHRRRDGTRALGEAGAHAPADRVDDEDHDGARGDGASPAQ